MSRRLTRPRPFQQRRVSLRPGALVGTQRHLGGTSRAQVGGAAVEPLDLRLACGIQAILVQQHAITPEGLYQQVVNAARLPDSEDKCFGERSAKIGLPALGWNISSVDIVPDHRWDQVA